MAACCSRGTTFWTLSLEAQGRHARALRTLRENLARIGAGEKDEGAMTLRTQEALRSMATAQ